MHLERQEVVGLLVLGDAGLEALHLFGDELREADILDAAAEAGAQLSIAGVCECELDLGEVVHVLRINMI